MARDAGSSTSPRMTVSPSYLAASSSSASGALATATTRCPASGCLPDQLPAEALCGAEYRHAHCSIIRDSRPGTYGDDPRAPGNPGPSLRDIRGVKLIRGHPAGAGVPGGILMSQQGNRARRFARMILRAVGSSAAQPGVGWWIEWWTGWWAVPTLFQQTDDAWHYRRASRLEEPRIDAAELDAWLASVLDEPIPGRGGHMTHDAGISARPDCENQSHWIKRPRYRGRNRR